MHPRVWMMMAALCFASAGAAAGATANPAVAAGLPPLTSRPAEPGVELSRLIGEYGTADTLLTVYEADGHLFADGGNLHRAPLRHVAAGRFTTAGRGGAQRSTLDFSPDRGTVASGGDLADTVVLDGTRLPRRDVGGEVVQTIRAGVHADVAALRAAALRATPPPEPPATRANDLVDLAGIAASIKFDIRYATTNNFMGFALYERPAAYLQRPAAEALRRVADALAPLGYGLLIHDAYRPWFVTKMFWDATPDAAHVFVADPAAGSRHNRGCAVDLTLYDLATGQAVQMTGRYDEMSRRSFADYLGGTSRERWQRDLLRRAMEQQGFTVYPQEWWHFDYAAWHDYAIGNVPFERLEAAPHHSG